MAPEEVMIAKGLALLLSQGGGDVQFLMIAGGKGCDDTDRDPGPNDRFGVVCGTSPYEGATLFEAVNSACCGELGPDWQERA